MPLYTFLYNLLNVLVQIADKMGLQKKILTINSDYFLKLHQSIRLVLSVR
jgi:hypothetical protein